MQLLFVNAIISQLYWFCAEAVMVWCKQWCMFFVGCVVCW